MSSRTESEKRITDKWELIFKDINSKINELFEDGDFKKEVAYQSVFNTLVVKKIAELEIKIENLTSELITKNKQK